MYKAEVKRMKLCVCVCVIIVYFRVLSVYIIVHVEFSFLINAEMFILNGVVYLSKTVNIVFHYSDKKDKSFPSF